MKHNFSYWLVYTLLFIWQIPQNLIAIIMLPFLGKLSKIANRHYSYAFVGKNMKGGISLGNFIFVSETLSKNECTIAHELDGHTVDSKIMGPLYLIIIGLPSILWAWLRNPNKQPNYYAFYTERLANWHAGLKAVKTLNYNHYHLEFK